MTDDVIKRDIIDNTEPKMRDVLNSEIPRAEQMDISTGYFDVPGYGMLRDELEKSVEKRGFFLRLLLGREAILPKEDSFEKYARRYNPDNEGISSVKSSLEDTELTSKTLDDTASLIALLERPNVEVRQGVNRFNHSKCYILGNNSVFIGSSNFTAGGMTQNYELNAGLYQPGINRDARRWFDRMWDAASKDTKQELIDTLKQSKFGAPPDPFPVYMKMLFERFRPLFENMDQDVPKYSRTLTKFQQDAVQTCMFIMSDFDGVIIADATGLGKTNMGIEIMRQKVLKEGKRVMLVAPHQVLHSMWEEKLDQVDINVRTTLTMETLGRETVLNNPHMYKNIDLVVIDESQNFRSRGANRRKNLMKLMTIGKRKQVVLLTATPVNNSIMDLYYQLSIITGGDDSYFYKTVGIADLYRHMKEAAGKEGISQGLDKIQQLLDTVMVRRTRSYIKDVYRDDRIGGKEIKFPTRRYLPINYSINDLFGNIFEKMVNDIEGLTMAPYGIERYDTTLSDDEKRKHRVMGKIQVVLLLKRFESSVKAVTDSLENKMNLYRYIRGVLDEGLILRVGDFNKIIIKWRAVESGEEPDTEDDEDPKMEFFLKEIKKIQKEPIGRGYDVASLKRDMDADMEVLKNLLDDVKKITVDTKIDEVIKTIMRDKALETGGKKVLIFTEYTTTAKYITHELRKKFPGHTTECIMGITHRDTRIKYIRRFAPKANLSEDDGLSEPEIDILVSTEVLSEGQNLQDCNYVVNYDLPWNPMRIVQRTGRVDRLTSVHDTIHTRACFPDTELDGFLKLVGKVIGKIGVVNDTVGLDEEVLGEIPTPKQFNGTLTKRIMTLAGKGDGDPDGLVQKMEQESDIMPATSPISELGRYIKEMGIETMKEIPMGRRSGKRGAGEKAILAYMQERPRRHVYFVSYDFASGKASIPDDYFDAIRTAACTENTQKYLPMDGPDNRRSFELLFEIDQKARKAIRENNERAIPNLREQLGNNLQRHSKNISKISEIIVDEIRHGKITIDEGKTVTDIVKS